MPRKKAAAPVPVPEAAPAPVPAYKRGREFKVILPPDLSERIERQAQEEGRPQSRVIVNDLAAIPWLRSQAALAETVRDMQVILARYGSRLTLSDVNDELMAAIDELLAAQGDAELQARVDKVRVVRSAMKKHQPRMRQALDADDQREKARIDAYRQSERAEAERRQETPKP
jgi:hypothetical protein